MFIARARKTLDHLDQDEFDEKQAKYEERIERERLNLKITSDLKSNNQQFKPDELPDGACFRLKSVSIGTDDATTAIRQAEV